MRINFIQNLIDKLRGKEQKLQHKQQLLALDEIKYIFLPALETNKNTFLKYKDCYKGKDIVLVASGPTMLQYHNDLLKDAVHIGVNNVFEKENVQLDYLFVQDNLTIRSENQEKVQEKANNYRKGICKKFYGEHYCANIKITEQDYDEACAERYYFIDQQLPVSPYAMMSADITTRPLNEWSSVIFAALEFAFWTHPRRIYLVGCDASANGHIVTKNLEDFCTIKDRLVYGWHQYANYWKWHYPDIEVISINPVGLKGLFKDVYTQNYIDEHPESLEIASIIN